MLCQLRIIYEISDNFRLFPRNEPEIVREDVRDFPKTIQLFPISKRKEALEYAYSGLCLFFLIVDRHHIDYRTLGSQAAANLLGEVNKKSNLVSCNRYVYFYEKKEKLINLL